MPGTRMMTTKWTLRHTCAAVFVVCFCLLAIRPEAALFGRGIPESGEEVRVARSIAFHGTFENPFVAGNTGETAHVAPVYPLLYAAYIKVFGTGYAAQIMLGALTVALFALQLALLPWIADRLGLHPGVGIAAATLGVLSAHELLDGSWDQYFTGLLLLLAFALVLETKTIRWAALTGLLWGTIILTNPVALLLLMTWPFALWKRQGFGPRFATMLCGATLVVTPWVIRDYAQFGALMFVRDNLGLELHVANNPCATPAFYADEESGCFNKFHPNSNPDIARQVASQGEYAFNQQCLRLARAWIGSNRERFAALTAQRIREFWFPTLNRKWEQVPVWIVTVLAFGGLALLWRGHRRLAAAISATWFFYPLIYYVLVAEPRYAFPICWTLFLPAGTAVKGLAQFLPIYNGADVVKRHRWFCE